MGEKSNEGGEAPNIKIQAPEKRQAPRTKIQGNSKFQTPNPKKIPNSKRRGYKSARILLCALENGRVRNSSGRSQRPEGFASDPLPLANPRKTSSVMR